MENDGWVPVTHENCNQMNGPFYHGTRSELPIGALLVAGFPSNFEESRISNNIYFTSVLDTAIWGAELATSLANVEGPGYIYIVEPLGPFEDDPNVTNKRFAGNPTGSYRTCEPLRIVGLVEDWEAHPPGALQDMLDFLESLRRQGLAIIED